MSKPPTPHFLAGLSLLVLASTSHAAVLLSETEFTSATAQDRFTSGTDLVGTFYYASSGGGAPDSPSAGPMTTGGNPGAYLSIGVYENSALVPLQAPQSLSSISFDYAYESQSTFFGVRIYGLTAGQTVNTFDRDRTNNPDSSGTLLYTSPSRNTGTNNVFTSTSFDLSGVAALQDLSAFQTVVFKFPANFNPSTKHGIDNVVIQGTAVPEPTTALLLTGTLGLMGGLARRRK